LGNKGITELSS